jgi:hypothetical protein
VGLYLHSQRIGVDGNGILENVAISDASILVFDTSCMRTHGQCEILDSHLGVSDVDDCQMACLSVVRLREALVFFW